MIKTPDTERTVKIHVPVDVRQWDEPARLPAPVVVPLRDRFMDCTLQRRRPAYRHDVYRRLLPGMESKSAAPF